MSRIVPVETQVDIDVGHHDPDEAAPGKRHVAPVEPGRPSPDAVARRGGAPSHEKQSSRPPTSVARSGSRTCRPLRGWRSSPSSPFRLRRRIGHRERTRRVPPTTGRPAGTALRRACSGADSGTAGAPSRPVASRAPPTAHEGGVIAEAFGSSAAVVVARQAESDRQRRHEERGRLRQECRPPAGKAPNQACSDRDGARIPAAGVKRGGATVGLMYGGYQTCVASKARSVR